MSVEVAIMSREKFTEKFERLEEKWHLTLEKNRIKSVSFSREVGRAVRVIVDGRVGFSSAVGASFEDIEKKAVELAKYGSEMNSFPEGGRRGVKVYDRRFEEVNAEFLKSLGERAIDSLKSGEIATGAIEISRLRTRIENPSFCGEYEETSAFFFVEVIRSGSAYNYVQSRKVELDVEKVVEEAEELAEKPVESVSGKMRVVLSPMAFSQIVSHTLYPAFSAESVEKGRSRVSIGANFGWDFEIFDDPTLDWGLSSYPFDDEGVKAGKRCLYSGGVRTLLSDWKFSGPSAPPGNAVREESTSYPSIAPSNVFFEFERSGVDESDGLYVHCVAGAHTANSVSGDFSVECLNAFYRGRAVRAMLYGNVYSMLENVIAQSEPVQIDSTVVGRVLFEEKAIRVV